MITVTIFINGSPIYSRSARNLTGKEKGLSKYRCDDGTIIKHQREEGAIILAKRMLDTIEEI